MKKYWISSFVLLLCLASALCGAEAVEGIITAKWLNARIFPELKSSRVTKLPRGLKVAVFKRHGSWLEIAAPDTTPVFASAAYVSGNKVLRDLNLRTAPHSGAPVISRVKKGTILKAVSEPDRYGWVQVAPSADMRLYVVETYVNYDRSKVPVAKKGVMPQAAPAPEKKAEVVKKAAPAPEKKAEVVKRAAPAPEKKAEVVKKAAPAPEKKAEVVKKAAPAPEKKAEVVKKAAPAPEKKAEVVKKAAPAPATVKKELANFDLTSERKQELLNIGADITKSAPYAQTGILVAVPNPGGDCTRYALADANGNNKGFLFAEAPVKLGDFVEKSVAVKGVAYQIPKWKNPVVAVTLIVPAGESK